MVVTKKDRAPQFPYLTISVKFRIDFDSAATEQWRHLSRLQRKHGGRCSYDRWFTVAVTDRHVLSGVAQTTPISGLLWTTLVSNVRKWVIKLNLLRNSTSA